MLVSDMCPSVSGDRSKDATLSAELGMCALHLALGQSETDDSISETGGILLPGGSLVIKLLEGEESQGNSTLQHSFDILLRLHSVCEHHYHLLYGLRSVQNFERVTQCVERSAGCCSNL